MDGVARVCSPSTALAFTASPASRPKVRRSWIASPDEGTDGVLDVPTADGEMAGRRRAVDRGSVAAVGRRSRRRAGFGPRWQR
eukprot:3954432-Prymnesium_polylepis.1